MALGPRPFSPSWHPSRTAGPWITFWVPIPCPRQGLPDVLGALVRPARARPQAMPFPVPEDSPLFFVTWMARGSCFPPQSALSSAAAFCDGRLVGQRSSLWISQSRKVDYRCPCRLDKPLTMLRVFLILVTALLLPLSAAAAAPSTTSPCHLTDLGAQAACCGEGECARQAVAGTSLCASSSCLWPATALHTIGEMPRAAQKGLEWAPNRDRLLSRMVRPPVPPPRDVVHHWTA
jgi:hypothetical protein